MNEKYLKLTLVILWNLKSPLVEIHRCGRQQYCQMGNPEVSYHRLLLGQKRQFDEAMTKELSQVLPVDAVRRLTQEEELKVRI